MAPLRRDPVQAALKACRRALFTSYAAALAVVLGAGSLFDGLAPPVLIAGGILAVLTAAVFAAQIRRVR